MGCNKMPEVRLIDGRALLDILCSDCTKCSNGICHNEYGKCAEYTIIEKMPTIPDIDRTAILRWCHEIEEIVTAIANWSENWQTVDDCRTVCDKLKEIGKELTGDAGTD